jgi:hypothetical protein
MPEMHLTTETFRRAGIGVDHGYAHSLNVSAESTVTPLAATDYSKFLSIKSRLF